MLEDSLDFMSKKAWFQHVTLNVNTVQLMHHFWGSVPTTFDEHCSLAKMLNCSHKLIKMLYPVKLCPSIMFNNENESDHHDQLLFEGK